MRNLNRLLKLLELLIIDNDKLLIRGAFRIKLITLRFKSLFKFHGHRHSMSTDLHIQVVGKEHIKLNANDAPLRKNSAALLLNSEEVFFKVFCL